MNALILLLLALLTGADRPRHKLPQRPHVDTRAQSIVSGDMETWYVGALHTTIAAPVAEADPAFAFVLSQTRLAASATGDADVLDAEWRDQSMTLHKVHTVKGINEKPKDFVQRHVETVKALQAEFPPVPQSP